MISLGANGLQGDPSRLDKIKWIHTVKVSSGQWNLITKNHDIADTVENQKIQMILDLEN